MPGAGLLGAGEPGATPPLVASVVFLGVVVRGGTAVLPHTATSKYSGDENGAWGLGAWGAGARA